MNQRGVRQNAKTVWRMAAISLFLFASEQSWGVVNYKGGSSDYAITIRDTGYNAGVLVPSVDLVCGGVVVSASSLYADSFSSTASSFHLSNRTSTYVSGVPYNTLLTASGSARLVYGIPAFQGTIHGYSYNKLTAVRSENSVEYTAFIDPPQVIAPSGVSASDGTYGDGVRVSWTKIADEPCYRVYRSTSFEGTKTAVSGWTMATVFDDLTAVPGVIYYYWVQASLYNGTDFLYAGDYSSCDTGYAVNNLAINPTSRSHTSASASGQTIGVTATVSWTATAGAAWLTVTGGSSGSGNGTVTYSVAANGATTNRSGRITVAGGGSTRTFTVDQAATAVSLAISPPSRSHTCAAADGQMIGVTANTSWTATSGVAWLTVTGGSSGSGNGTVTYSVAANGATTNRSGTITVAGGGSMRTFTVDQAAAAPLAISPSSRSHTCAAADGQTIGVTANTSWTATAGVEWLTVTAGSSGSGNGTVTYRLAENNGMARSGTITVAGGGLTLTFTVNQAALEVQGSGTAADPYLISNKAQLLAKATDPSLFEKHFKLTADIDLAGERFTAAVIAPAVNPTKWTFGGTPYSGTFDGNGRVIRNLSINAPSGLWIGFFGQLSGTVKNLGLENCTIIGSGVVAGLCADNFYGRIENCFVSGTVNGAEYSGGVCGDNYCGTIINCFSICSVYSGVWRGGGLCGRNYTGCIENCYSAGSVSGGREIGGLTGNDNYGGTVSVTLNSFWDTQASGRSTSAGGTGLGTTQMKNASTFINAGWDFSESGNWRMSAPSEQAGGYPVLRLFANNTVTLLFDAQGGTAPVPAGKSVTFGAAYGALATTAREGYTFAGWWTAAGGAGTEVTSATTVTVKTAQTLYAQWRKNPTEERVTAVGVSFSTPLSDAFAGAAKVTVKNPPPGLKYNSKTGLIEGVPTKAGTYTVAISATGVAAQTLTITVEALPPWAQGTFNGYVAGGGLASMSVTAAGKITGKVSVAGTNYTFGAASYAAGGSAETSFAIETAAKAGKVSLPLALTVAKAETPASLGAAAGTLGGLAVGLWSDVWKSEAARLTPLTGYHTATLAGGAEYGSGYLTFTVDKAGKVKIGGKLADGTAVSVGGTLILDAGNRVFAVVYAAPKTYSGGGLFGLAELVDPGSGGKVFLRLLDGEPFAWWSLNPQAEAVYGAGFDRALELAGGWYSKSGDLGAYYAGRNLAVGADTNAPAPELTVGTIRYDSVCWNPSGIALTPTGKPGAMTGLAAPAAGKPVDPDKDGEWDYSAANAVGLKISLARPTGIFKGSFLAWFDYPEKKHVSKSLAFEGALTPVRENADDGVEGRGFFLWADQAVNPATGKFYPFKGSYDFLIAPSE